MKDISKGTLQMLIFKKMMRKTHILQKHVSMKLLEVSLSCLDTSPLCSLREKSSLPIYCKCGEP